MQLTQESVDALREYFNVPTQDKKIKLSMKNQTTIGNAVVAASSWLDIYGDAVGITQIEFKYGRNYIIITKLKD